MDSLGIREAEFSHTCCVTLGKLDSLGFCSLVYKMRRLDHLISSKVPFLFLLHIKCVNVGRWSDNIYSKDGLTGELNAVHA